MIDARCEVDFRRLERVVCGEVDREEEDAASVRRVTRTHYCGLPVELFVDKVSKGYDIGCSPFVSWFAKVLTAVTNRGRPREKRTRSSPIGPAEHDEGGSL